MCWDWRRRRRRSARRARTQSILSPRRCRRRLCAPGAHTEASGALTRPHGRLGASTVMAEARCAESLASAMLVTEMHPFSHTSPPSITAARPRVCSSTCSHALARGRVCGAWDPAYLCSPSTLRSGRPFVPARSCAPARGTECASEGPHGLPGFRLAPARAHLQLFNGGNECTERADGVLGERNAWRCEYQC